MRRLTRWGLLLFFVLLTACSPEVDTVRWATPPLTPPAVRASSTPAYPYPLPSLPPASKATPYPLLPEKTLMPSVPPASGDILHPLRPARDYLAQQLDLPPEEIVVATYEPTTFPDGCLGAPRPGEMCIQVLTPGYVVTFHTAKGDFIFHIAKSGYPFRLAGGGAAIQDK